MTTAGGSGWREEIRRRIRVPGGSVHLMGVGGIGMAGVARLLAAQTSGLLAQRVRAVVRENQSHAG